MSLLTLDEAKAQLDITTTTHDVELQAYIDSLTSVIEGIVGPVENRSVTEDIEGCGRTLALLHTPVVSLTSLTPVLATGLPVDVAGLHVDGKTGIIRRTDGTPFAGGPWTAVYTAGRGIVDPTINLASRILLQHLWRTQYGASRVSAGVGGGDDFAVTEPIPGYGYAVPNRVLQLLEPFRVPPGVG